jgi:hypothetical protein
MYQLGEKVAIDITRQEADFDRACDEALRQALRLFGVDANGYPRNVHNVDRSSATIVVEFLGCTLTASMMGREHLYRFEAVVTGAEQAESTPAEAPPSIPEYVTAQRLLTTYGVCAGCHKVFAKVNLTALVQHEQAQDWCAACYEKIKDDD